jgi:hypothetical protein
LIKWYYYENITGSKLSSLYSAHSFPLSPNGFVELASLQSPSNYNDNFGSIARGYIQAPITGKYVINMTGNQECAFFLSTNSSTNDTVEVARVLDFTSSTEHTKYASQTSDTIQLVAGQYYYFEWHHKESTGSDFSRVHWKTPNTIQGMTWEIISNIYLFDYTCATTCPIKGTPCDDSNANTVNDLEDGLCNCLGTPANANTCVGERGSMKAFYWDDIPGNNIYSLQSNADYPLKPDRTETLGRFKGPIMRSDSFGSRARAILIVPVTGAYTFNITGDDQTWLYFSSTSTFETATVIAEIPAWTNETEHTKYIGQTSATFQLQAGQLCYLEINHKEGIGGDHFAVHWKTPFYSNTNWKIIDGIYLYDYACEIACIPQGTPCDDGNALTYNDVYDSNCSCAGTSCPSGDCTGLGSDPSFPSYDQCAPTDKHSNTPEDSWLSCFPSPNPNTVRGTTHWIQYDFGSTVSLSQTKIWNYNVNDDLGRGFKDVVIDYSEDGVNWTQLGNFSWAQANGLDGYTGFDGPDFGGINARYVLITALSNWDNSNCMGFSQIEFTTTDSTCPQAGEICSAQGEALAVYDINCQCVPLSNPFNDCAASEINLSSNPIATGNYSAVTSITSTGTIPSTATVNMVAGESITLLQGFKATAGSTFTAKIIPCVPTNNGENDATLATLDDTKASPLLTEIRTTEIGNNTLMTVSPSPADTWTNIYFTLPTSTKVNLSIWDNAGRLVHTLASNQYFELGEHQKSFPAHRVPSGIYNVVLQTETTILTKQMVVTGTF